MTDQIKAYCISCGIEVEAKLVRTKLESQEFLQCSNCDSFLGTADQPQSLATPAPRPPQELIEAEPPSPLTEDLSAIGGDVLGSDLAELKMPSTEEMPEPVMETVDAATPGPLEFEELPQPATEPPIEIVMIAEDSGLLREMLTDTLVEKGLSRRVISNKNGFEFIVNYVKTRKKDQPIGLIIMDVNMPILNGISAAVALRAHETGRGIQRVPILFFTVKACDDTFKKVLSHCGPAMYINKGTSTSPEHLQERIGKVINQLLSEAW